MPFFAAVLEADERGSFLSATVTERIREHWLVRRGRRRRQLCESRFGFQRRERERGRADEADCTRHQQAKIPAAELNTLAGGYLLTRILFTFVYIQTTDEVLSALRSVLYVAGVAINSTLFIKAGLRLQ